MANTIKKCNSLPKYLVRNEYHKASRRQSSANTRGEKNVQTSKFFLRMEKTNSSTQTEFEMEWGPIIKDIFLCVILPTLDVGTDSIYLVNNLQRLYGHETEFPNWNELSHEGRCKFQQDM